MEQKQVLFFILIASLVLYSQKILVNTVEVNPLLRIDGLGSFTYFLDAWLSYLTKNSTVTKEEQCKSAKLSIGRTVLNFSNQPRGNCSYCCRLIDPNKYIYFHFTNKLQRGNIIRIKATHKVGSLQKFGINNKDSTIIYIHGFGGNSLGISATNIQNAYLSRNEGYNIFAVDWSELCPVPWYPTAIDNAKHVAFVLAEFLKHYNDNGELPIGKVHVIGFSLGAHLAGFLGKHLKGKYKLPRITGLDPAFPQFSLAEVSKRLSKLDADYVDIIHTDASLLGIPISIGHADFYPNGGKPVQPGCEASALSNRNAIYELVLCGHYRAWEFYIESVRNPNAFPATKCSVKEDGVLKRCGYIVHGYMGFPANKKTTLGNFYLNTNNRAPFGRSVTEQASYFDSINLIL